ncbi:MAG: YciI family protein [Halothece sp. Uz-M2-17]|nr:YciI family protein [Halothece sp. Uz-M2-17]
MPLFVKIEKGIVEKPIFDQYVPAHIDYVKQLVTQGYKARSGYWGDFGGGMLLFEAETLKEAQRIVEDDPLVKNGCVTYELHEWCVVVE